MAGYLMGGEGFKLKCTEQTLIENLIEMYTYNYKKAVELDNYTDENESAESDPNFVFELGQTQGQLDALSAILLFAIGGKEFYSLWTKTMSWATEELAGNEE